MQCQLKHQNHISQPIEDDSERAVEPDSSASESISRLKFLGLEVEPERILLDEEDVWGTDGSET